MKKNYILIILSVIFFEVANAQKIMGTITDATTKEELIGVNIILNNGQGTSTDINGKYLLPLQKGSHEINFKYIGYEDVIKIVNLQINEEKILNIALKTSSEELSLY